MPNEKKRPRLAVVINPVAGRQLDTPGQAAHRKKLDAEHEASITLTRNGQPSDPAGRSGRCGPGGRS